MRIHPATGNQMRIETSTLRSLLSGRIGASLARVLLLLGGFAPASAAQGARPCLPPDSTSAALSRLAVSIVSDTSSFARTMRSTFNIPGGTSQGVAIEEETAVCEAVTSAIDTGTGNYLPDALVVVRMGATSPFYLATNRRGGVMGVIYLLNSEPTLLASLTGT